MVSEKFNELFFPHDDKAEHLKSLDGLRGIAVLFVLLSHSSNQGISFHELINFKEIGKVGVYLFFVLSAYLLDRQIALAFMTNKSSKRYWKNYCLRRFLRIYPLFIIALMLHGFLNVIGFQTVIDKITDFPMHILLLRGESIFWSIPVEFKYYFISQLLIWFCHKHLKWDKMRLIFAFMIVIVVSILIELIFRLPLISTFRYFPIFMIGTLLSIYELLIKKEKLESINPRTLNLMGIVGFAIIAITIPFYSEQIFSYKIDFQSSVFYLPYALIWGVILWSAKYGNGIVKKILELKSLRFIGSISFSMYLFHMLFLNFVKNAGLHESIQIYVFFILTVIFSTLSFLIIERPLSKIRMGSK